KGNIAAKLESVEALRAALRFRRGHGACGREQSRAGAPANRSNDVLFAVHRKSHRNGIDCGLGLDGPQFFPRVRGVSGKLTSSLPLKNEIARGRENAAVDSNFLFDRPPCSFRDGIPRDEAAEQSLAAFTGFHRSFSIRAPIRRWNINKPGKRVIAHGPPIVDGPLVAAY